MKSNTAIHLGFRHLLIVTIVALLWPAIPTMPLIAQDSLQDNAVDEVGIYSVHFTATWSAETHPNGAFPTASAHFSPMIGAVHGADVSFWNPGTLASEAIEQMAESGGTSVLRAEIADAITDGSTLSVISGGGASSPDAVEIGEIELNADFPLVTLVTMIAPSPDWFVGISGESLLDEQGDWIDERTFTLYPYDAGTDSGEQYVSANADTIPAQAIHSLRSQTPFSDAAIGTFTFMRVESSKVSIYLPWIAQ